MSTVRSRLQAALRAAMKRRDAAATSALRSALAAIANAEAVPVPLSGLRPAPPSENLPIAASDYRAAGRADRADRLLSEAKAIESALVQQRAPGQCFRSWTSNTS